MKELIEKLEGTRDWLIETHGMKTASVLLDASQLCQIIDALQAQESRVMSRDECDSIGRE